MTTDSRKPMLRAGVSEEMHVLAVIERELGEWICDGPDENETTVSGLIEAERRLFRAEAALSSQHRAIDDAENDTLAAEAELRLVRKERAEAEAMVAKLTDHLMARAALSSQHAEAVPVAPAKVKPLDLSALLRDAFLAGRGLKDGDRLSDADHTAWCAYDPERMNAYNRISAALYASPVVPADAGEPGIKALEWEERSGAHYADTALGECCIDEAGDGFYVIENGRKHSEFATADAAKAFVQKNHDAWVGDWLEIRSTLIPTTSPAKGGAEVAWARDDLAFGLASLDGVTLYDIRSTVGPAEDANNWRDYLGRADDLLAYLSHASALRTSAPVGQQAKEDE